MVEKSDKVVKIDAMLLKRVEDYINKAENKYKYVNKKQFIDIAVSEYLKKKVKNGKR